MVPSLLFSALTNVRRTIWLNARFIYRKISKKKPPTKAAVYLTIALARFIKRSQLDLNQRL